jgi:hypothetical protein
MEIQHVLNREKRIAKMIIENIHGYNMTARMYQNRGAVEYGLCIDWHVYSEMLDVMCNNGVIKLSGHDNSGMCQYNVGG